MTSFRSFRQRSRQIGVHSWGRALSIGQQLSKRQIETQARALRRLTTRSSGCPTACFARFQSPLTSNVRAQIHRTPPCPKTHSLHSSGPLPGQGMRAARGDPLRRYHLRLSALSRVGLLLSARNCCLQSAAAVGQDPGSPGLACGIANPEGSKPKGMHWRTFERLTEEHDAFVQVSLAETVRRFKLRI